MNFFDAINVHIAWKVRLAKYIDGTSDETLDPEVICRDDVCPLGKWIYENLEEHGEIDEFHTMRDLHANFHEAAAEIVRMADSGEGTKAEECLHGDYARLSNKVVKSITHLDRKLNQENYQ